MSGIVFLKTRELASIKRFYLDELEMQLWLDQGDCAILKHGNLLLGFCEREGNQSSWLVTLFYETKAELDRVYARLERHATGEPSWNEKYSIYHFFATDPEGRRLEFQVFSEPLAVPWLDGQELLAGRRSVRQFRSDPVTRETLLGILESCRWAPSSRNTQPCYFVPIEQKPQLEWLGSLRGLASAPIERAPLAVAICSDPEVSRRHTQDACIAAYHFLLAARLHGLGCCWIAAMDRDDVKQALGIPLEHYVATITPLGYPAERPEPRERRSAASLLRRLSP